MNEPAKYVIRATVTANGVVERSDVVGAVYGQTEGLLGDEIDIRSLQEADRIGRIEVDIESAAGRSTGDITIASDLDQVETAVLGAALETIERVGPARATVSVDRIEDVRAAKRRDIVERARELLAGGFEDVGLQGRDLVSAVRESVTPAEPIEFEGLPAGPDVPDAGDVVIVEGRADVLRLLEFGVTNVIGVEGTDVSEPIIDLTRDHEVTAFFDGDRGGDLLLLELAQVGDVDHVAFAPPGRAVEELTIAEIHDALARKVPYEQAATDATDGDEDEGERIVDGTSSQLLAAENGEDTSPSLATRVEEILGGSGNAVLLDEAGKSLVTGDAREIESLLAEYADHRLGTVILDGTIDQRLADMASRLGVTTVVAARTGEFAKRPTDVRIVTEADLAVEAEG